MLRSALRGLGHSCPLNEHELPYCCCCHRDTNDSFVNVLLGVYSLIKRLYPPLYYNVTVFNQQYARVNYFF